MTNPTPHGQVPEALTHERDRAFMEGERNASLDAYSRVVYLTQAESRIYETAFTNGWNRRASLSPPAAVQEPVEHQYLGTDGKWHDFIDARHCKNTIESGLWQIRSLYAAPQPAVAAGWVELCRRLYVELFHCDQQLMGCRDENDEPVWTQGVTVRDVLADAKAALSAIPPAPSTEGERNG